MPVPRADAAARALSPAEEGWRFPEMDVRLGRVLMNWDDRYTSTR